jgi:hypothetical protein
MDQRENSRKKEAREIVQWASRHIDLASATLLAEVKRCDLGALAALSEKCIVNTHYIY